MSQPITNPANPSGLSADQLQHAEAKLGRPLSMKEQATGQMERVDTRDTRTKIDDGNWKVPMKPDDSPTSSLDLQLAYAESEVEKSRLASMNTAERRLHEVKKARQQELNKIKADDAHKAFLNSPKIKGAVDELTALVEDARWNPEISFAETVKLKQALDTLITPGSDTDAAFKMVDAIRSEAATKREAKRQSLSTKMSALDSERLRLERQIAELAPKPDTSPKWKGAKPTFDEVDALWSKYAGLDRTSAEGEAALVKWNDAVEAFGGLDSIHAEEKARKAKGK